MSEPSPKTDLRPHMQDLTTEELRARLQEAEEALDAIRSGAVDAVIGMRDDSTRLYTLDNADRPYRELIEQMNEGALMLSVGGAVLYANRRLSELLGKPVDAIVGQSFAEHIGHAAQPKFEKLFASGLTRATRQEFEIVSGNGKNVPVSISLSPLHVDWADDQTIVCAVISDLTEQRQVEAQLRQSQKMEAIGQLTGGLAHDFNNLLQAIHGNLELIQRLPANVEKVKHWASNAARSVERGAKLTAQLLAFSRSQQIALSSVVVDELVDGMEEMLTRSVGFGVTVEFRLDSRAKPVIADPTQLELALLNLAINARDAMPEGGSLLISSCVVDLKGDAELQDETYVEIRVADSGQGMSEEVRLKAFDPFFTTKGIGAGTGLGLAQVYGIARQAGGTARINSETGRGTAVSIFLRTTGLPAEAAAASVDRLSTYAIKPKRILVVDDDADVRSFLTESLELLGYTVDTAVDSADASHAIDQHMPDIALLDYAMPQTTGGELAAAIRQRLPRLPIAFVTGFASNLDFTSIPGPKPVVLLKPFPIEVLAATVARMLV